MLVVIVVAIVALLVINKDENQEDISQKTTEQGPAIHAYVGEIKAVGEDKIAIHAKANNNDLEKDTLLTINFDTKTKFYKLIIAKQLRGDAEEDRTKRTFMEKSELEVGQKIVVFNGLENLRDKTEFIAEKVEVHVVE